MTIPSFRFAGRGYSPELLSRGWQIAFLTSVDTQEFESIRRLDRHLLTDEAFVLLEGRAWLIGAEEAGGDLDLHVEAMSPSVIYNIPENMWHNIVLDAGTRVLIVERDGTHVSDFEFRDLGDAERDRLHTLLVGAGMEGKRRGKKE